MYGYDPHPYLSSMRPTSGVFEYATPPVILCCLINTIQEHLEHRDGDLTTSKYNTLSTERLLALAESRFHDLLQDHWHEVEGRATLTLLTELAGLKPTLSSSAVVHERPSKSESMHALDTDDTDNQVNI
jgi:hypothetical protein